MDHRNNICPILSRQLLLACISFFVVVYTTEVGFHREDYMAYYLSGTWQNKDKSDNDTVVILHLRDDAVKIIGYGDKPKSFQIIGIGMIEGDFLIVEWTDLPDSNGDELGKAHRAKIEIISNSELKQISDVILPSMKKSSNKSYGNWIRK